MYNTKRSPNINKYSIFNAITIINPYFIINSSIMIHLASPPFKSNDYSRVTLVPAVLKYVCIIRYFMRKYHRVPCAIDKCTGAVVKSGMSGLVKSVEPSSIINMYNSCRVRMYTYDCISSGPCSTFTYIGIFINMRLIGPIRSPVRLQLLQLFHVFTRRNRVISNRRKFSYIIKFPGHDDP